MFGKRPWSQAAIDKFDLESAIPCAKMAIECGVDWLEIGTPLIYAEGFKAIEELKKIADDAPVITDFKIRTNVYEVLVEAKKHGCDIATISCAGGNDSGILEGLHARRDCGIKIVGDMCGLEVADIPKRARELERMGVDGICIHYGDDQWFYNYQREMTDGILKAKAEAPHTPLGCCCGYAPPGKGCGCNALENVIEAIKQGADWVVVGGALANDPSPENYENFRFLTDMVKDTRK
jgi:3-hexulose-6-phosphate synthase/6-phospho-3-hexuloisomerase